MFSELQHPGYLHILINHLPIIGTAMGVLALLVGLALRSRAALLPGLVIVLVAGISAWPVYETGSDAYKSIRKISDYDGSDWLDEHMDRADKTVWTFYAMGRSRHRFSEKMAEGRYSPGSRDRHCRRDLHGSFRVYCAAGRIGETHRVSLRHCPSTDRATSRPFMIKRLFLLGVALALSACAVTSLPKLPPTHPASPDAAPAPVRPRDSLSADEATCTTDELLSTGPSSTPPDSGSDNMSDMPGMPGMNH
ncbi:MAG TPA: hypothetical protein VIM61_01595 [Chthoniobacterales bacterium]